MWRFYQPVQVIFGEGEIGQIGKHMDGCGLKKAFMVADAFLVE